MVRVSLLSVVLLLLASCAAEPPADTRTQTPQTPPKADNWRVGGEDRALQASLDSEQLTDSGAVLHASDCISPCTFETTILGEEENVTYVEYSADGWYLGRSFTPPFTVTYAFSQPGERVIQTSIFSKTGMVTSVFKIIRVETAEAGPACDKYESALQDNAPIQVTGETFPASTEGENWFIPSTYTKVAPFMGEPGHLAAHEGVDYIHDDENTGFVPVIAASRGTVVYVRTGCDQSDMFLPNILARECGSGWGNHLVIHHGENIYTRYAHLAPGSLTLRVGDSVDGSDYVGEMGNTGRSETRHLHFELGVTSIGFDPCSGSQSFDEVFDPSLLGVD